MALIRILLEYDGSDFAGFQKQSHAPSVAGALISALHKVTGEDAESFDLRVAGRTDSGVHALGQVVTFQTQSLREPRRFAPALNHFLPVSIRVQRAETAPQGFDARRSAIAKTYIYQVYQGPHAVPLLHRRAWHVRSYLDVDAMMTAGQALVGEHDFESFRSAHCDAAHARRHIHAIRIDSARRGELGRLHIFSLHANAFCRHMCRIIVGTLVAVGRGDMAPDAMKTILAALKREAAGETAPGCGLTLQHVHYPEQMAFLAKEPEIP